MIETVPLEVCAECLITVATGRGDDYRVNLLWRKFQGGLVVSEVDSVVTFRACGACGDDAPGVRYEGRAVIKYGEDAEA